MRFIGLQPQQPAGKREVSGGLFISFDVSYLLTGAGASETRRFFYLKSTP